MPSSYSSSLRIELQADGENDSTWGDKANAAFNTIEDSIAGIATITLSDSDYSLSVAYGSTDEARKAIVVVTGNITTQRNIIVPAESKTYVIRNVTSGGFSLLVKTQIGQGVVVKNGDTTFMYCDGSNLIAVAGGGGSGGGVLPTSISTAVGTWAFYGSVAINRTEAAQPGFGRYAVDGTSGSEINVYFNSVLAGKTRAKLNGSNQLVGFDHNANGVPLSLSMNGTPALQVETDGTVDCAKTFTAAALVSTGTIAANGNISAFSDERLKANWEPLQYDFVARLARVKYGTYSRNDMGMTKRRYAGVSAQSLQALLPEVVEERDKLLTVAYGNAAMVSVIELAKEVGMLKDELLALKKAVK